MSGWLRLWLVLSLVIGLPVFFIQWNEDRHFWKYYEPSDVVQRAANGNVEDMLLVEAKFMIPELADCMDGTVEIRRVTYGSGYDIDCTLHGLDALFPAIWYAIFPAIFLFAVGWTIGWVYRGFRPKPVSSR